MQAAGSLSLGRAFEAWSPYLFILWPNLLICHFLLMALWLVSSSVVLPPCLWLDVLCFPLNFLVVPLCLNLCYSEVFCFPPNSLILALRSTLWRCWHGIWVIIVFVTSVKGPSGPPVLPGDLALGSVSYWVSDAFKGTARVSSGESGENSDSDNV